VRSVPAAMRYDRTTLADSLCRRFPATRLKSGNSEVSALRRTLLLVVALWPAVAAAQDRPPVDSPPVDVDRGRWEPLGPLAVDQAGGGFRGYALPADGADVGTGAALSVHAVTSNNFYNEQTNGFSITQRYETHTFAIGYRRGFDMRHFPQFELGGQLQLIESDAGFLNGFILGFENMLASLSGVETARNALRESPATRPPLGTIVTKSGAPVYRAAGDRSGFGDFSMFARARIAGDTESSYRLAARVGLNLAGTSEFTAGNFAGVGLALEKKLNSRAAFHGDLRASLLLDRTSEWNLPLRSRTLGFSAGFEMKLSRNNSANVQLDGTTTPYLPTGTLAFDKGYGDITFGVSHRSAGNRVLTQFYMRENMNLPFKVRWNLDPDLSLGIKATIRLRPR
jgi:hypothetical protein